ncbi:MAG TPA: hypothetical protein VD902_20660 [Symbiobacteriaceae bacterium]|nr:hypothetical protein [Symbiobacteriaceae bacterium]
MFANIARIVGAVLLGAAVAGSFVITRYLSLLEGGIQRDLAAVERIAQVELEIQKQNEILTDMVAVTQRIDAGLDGVLTTSRQIGTQVVSVGEFNRDTLRINGVLKGNNAAAAAEMNKVVAALQEMNASASAIDRYLVLLRDTVGGDVSALEALAANTARMNAKTPEVKFQ